MRNDWWFGPAGSAKMLDKIAFDVELMRPGCVLIQAALGCDSAVARPFDSRDWLVHLTPGMKVYPLAPGQLEQLVQMVEERNSHANPTNQSQGSGSEGKD